jgi:hypothetical protein
MHLPQANGAAAISKAQLLHETDVASLCSLPCHQSFSRSAISLIVSPLASPCWHWATN